jgi:hypothetical protein
VRFDEETFHIVGGVVPVVTPSSSTLAPAGVLVIFKLCAREGVTEQTSKEARNAARTGRRRSMRGCSSISILIISIK